MSQLLDQFVAAAKRRDWINAFLLANGLSMEEMLSGMVTIGPPLLFPDGLDHLHVKAMP